MSIEKKMMMRKTRTMKRRKRKPGRRIYDALHFACWAVVVAVVVVMVVVEKSLVHTRVAVVASGFVVVSAHSRCVVPIHIQNQHTFSESFFFFLSSVEKHASNPKHCIEHSNKTSHSITRTRSKQASRRYA